MSTNLIQVVNNDAYTTSLLVSEKFKKRHWTIVRDIDNLISALEGINKTVDTPLFVKGEHVNEQNGQSYPMYYINRDGFALLVMGFNNTRDVLEWKIKYVEAFNAMKKKLSEPTLIDCRMEIARLIISAPKERVEDIKELYPEYFTIRRGSLEYMCDVNTSFTKWIEDYGITKDWIGSFPTIDIYHNYMRYCIENKCPSMGKKVFYKTLEYNFNMTRRQRSGGSRYFMSA